MSTKIKIQEILILCVSYFSAHLDRVHSFQTTEWCLFYLNIHIHFKGTCVLNFWIFLVSI